MFDKLYQADWKPESPDKFGEIADLVKSIESLKVEETKPQATAGLLLLLGVLVLVPAPCCYCTSQCYCCLMYIAADLAAVFLLCWAAVFSFPNPLGFAVNRLN